jgi:hypothetical protein
MVNGKDRRTSSGSPSASDSGPRGTPGKRARTDALQLRRGAQASRTAVPQTEPLPPPADDPFGLHLLGAVAGVGGALERLATLEQGIADSVRRARAAAREGAEVMRPESVVLGTMLRAATSIVGSIDDDDERDRAAARLRRIEARLEELWVQARRERIDQAAAGLDEVFLAEDALAVAAGREAPRRRATFYADRTAADLRGEARPDGVSVEPRTGQGLIQAFVDWFHAELRDHSKALESVRDVVDEPVAARSPSAVESLIATAARTLVGMLPGHLLGAVTDAVWSWAKASRSGQAPAQGQRVKDPNLGGVEQDVIAAVAKFVRPTVDDVLARGPAKIAPEQAGAAVSGPIAHAFVERMTAEVSAYEHAATAQLGELRSGLALVPPAGLEVLVSAMQHGSAGRVAKLQADALVKWTAFVAEVTSGRDEHGNNAHGGALPIVVDMPGTLQLALVVRKAYTTVHGPNLSTIRLPHALPQVEVRRVWMNGVGDRTKAKLRAAARPLRSVAMHRALMVSIEDAESGAEMPIGRIDVGPEGQFNVDAVRWTELAMLAGGETPDEPTPDATERTLRQADGASKPRAQAGAQVLLNHVRETTADIE